jgi:hypothetical protein
MARRRAHHARLADPDTKVGIDAIQARRRDAGSDRKSDQIDLEIDKRQPGAWGDARSYASGLIASGH